MARGAPRHNVPSRAPHPQVKRESAHARGYTRKWQKARAGYLRNHPLCVACLADGEQLSPSTVVDHIIPHKGDMARFWDSSNWQALCKAHHDAKTATEDGGFGNAPRRAR